MNEPLFSIVMPAYNRANLIVRALESVYAQKFQSYEVLVVDDGSTDDTAQRIEPFVSRGLRYFKLATNRGVGPARNHGVREARGQWVIFFDTDNILLDDALSLMSSRVQAMAGDVAVVLGRAVDMSGRDLPGLRREGSVSFSEYMRSGLPEGLPALRRDLALRFPFAEDLGTRRECGGLLWMDLGKHGYKFYFVDEVILRYDCEGTDRLSARSFLARAPLDMLPCHERVLARFGEDLKRENPLRFISLLEKASIYAAMAGRRMCAATYAVRVFHECPRSYRWPLLLLLTAGGPKFATWVYRRFSGSALGLKIGRA